MKIILIIYLIVSILNLVLPYLAIQLANIEVKKDFPNVKYKKNSFLERLSAFLRAIVLAFFPVVNAITLLFVCANWETFVEMCYDKLVDRLEDEE